MVSLPEADRIAESGFITAVQDMLARPDYLLPLAAAERQFRDHYYGLNSAALLEDLFFDALGSFLRQTRPEVSYYRPATGQKGWDYAFDGLKISHKVSQDLGDIAALWDATKSGVTSWSFDEPITYVLGQNSPSTSLILEIDGVKPLRCRAMADLGSPYSLDGRPLMVVRWPAHGRQPVLLEIIPTVADQCASDVLSFEQVWRHVAKHVQEGGAANDIDVLVATARIPPKVTDYLCELGEQKIDVSVGRRGGVYVLSRDLLQGLTVKTNNRAILIPRTVVQELLSQAAMRNLFAPLPLWYWPFAQERPPDMYSAQRGEYEALFSARSDLR